MASQEPHMIIHRTMPGSANEPITEDDLEQHNAVLAELHGEMIPRRLRNPESPERAMHDKAAEQAWREDSARQAAHGCWETPAEPQRKSFPLARRVKQVVGAVAFAAVLVVWIVALWPK
jgi:hypothetical protein